MAKFKALPIAAAVATALVAMSASAVEFHGYMRAGVGNNVDGGSQVCYGNGGAAAHWVGRLGDECDMYAELTLGQEVYNRDGKTFGVVSTLAYGTNESLDVPMVDSKGNSWQEDGGSADSPWAGGRIAVREMYATAKGILGDSTIWAGKRFGQRKDIHIMDFFYLMNSGYGAGFDGLSAGPGKLSFQWVQSAIDGGTGYPSEFDWGSVESPEPLPGHDGMPAEQQIVNGPGNGFVRTNKLDVRYALPVFGDQNIEVVYIYGKPTLTDAGKDAAAAAPWNYNIQDSDSHFIMAEHTLPLLGGFNKFAAQYGTNGFALGASRDNFGGLNHATWFGEGDGFRLIDHGLVKLGKQVEISYALIYTKTNPDDDIYVALADGSTAEDPILSRQPWFGGNQWFASNSYSAVVRPMFKWNDVMSTALEVGYDTVEFTGDSVGCGSLSDPLNTCSVMGEWTGERRQARNGGEDLMKVTLAQQWSPLQNGGFWARPQFRVFVSKYSGDRVVDDADLMFGAQVEAWW